MKENITSRASISHGYIWQKRRITEIVIVLKWFIFLWAMANLILFVVLGTILFIFIVQIAAWT